MASAKALKETATQKVLQESQQVLEDQLSAQANAKLVQDLNTITVALE